MTAAAIIAPTVREASAKKPARLRSSVAIFAVTASHLTCRQLTLDRGVSPFMGQRKNTIDEMLEEAVRIALGAMSDQKGDVTGAIEGVDV